MKMPKTDFSDDIAPALRGGATSLCDGIAPALRGGATSTRGRATAWLLAAAVLAPALTWTDPLAAQPRPPRRKRPGDPAAAVTPTPQPAVPAGTATPIPGGIVAPATPGAPI